jgi:hypothetical protein
MIANDHDLMTVQVTKTETVRVTDKQLGWEILRRALEKQGIDDPGVDYFTDTQGNVYMSGDHWLGWDPRLATMVDAANYLIYGYPFKITPKESTNEPETSNHPQAG